MKKLLVLVLALVMCVATLVACGEPEIEYKLDKAEAYVKNLYNGEQIKPEGSDVACATKYADFKRVSSVSIAGVAYEVAWSVDVTDESKVKVIQGSGTTETVIDVNEKTAEDISFVLTATVKAGDGTSKTIKFNFFVPKYDVISYEDYRAKQTGDSATIEAVVVALNSKSAGNKRNHIFAVDAQGKGGYYAYDMADDPVKLGIEVGMTVAISGTVDIYNGMYELKDATARVVNAEKANVAPIDVSAKFGAGEDILQYVGSLITIKGVEIGGQELDVANSQYLFFTLNGNESYIRTYVTDLPTSFEVTTDEDGNTVCADKAVMDAAHAEKFGWTANVTGVLIAYNGTPYLMPVDTNCFEYITLVQKTDAEKIAIELDNVSFSSSYGSSTEIELLFAGINYDNVVFSYASSNTDVAVIEDGKLKLTVGDTEVTVDITVTATIGNTSDSKTVTIKLSKDPTPIKDIDALEDGTNVIVKGVVVEIASAWNDTYGNMSVWIFDGTGKIQAYRTTTQLKVGDQVTLTGKVGSYNSVKQIAAGSTAVVDVAAPEAATTVTDILTTDDGIYVMFSATVTEIKDAWSDKYGNISVWVTDGTTTFQAYRTTSKLEVGDTVTFFGKVGSYNGAKQLAAGSYAYVTAKAPAEGGVKVTLADYATANNWADATQYLILDISEDVKVTLVGGQNTGKYYNNGANWRIYQGETPTITFTASNDKTIKSVKVTYESNKTGVLVQGDVQIASDAVVEVNAASVVFGVGNTTDGVSNGQVRITAIEVVCE